ncbi:hypothetical protein [Pseudomonas sp. 25 E 4]|uniref:hypothetical protein n=1 Tax=Pseudomonas sp. 25 E 4 TaxID=1844097 RepID=UPI000812484B|nr:hypothetical protein [Pseudomonas sp. 25 E 4]CRM69696.1 hypothetical protein [Pseudomonas sp. 25 E 4]
MLIAIDYGSGDVEEFESASRQSDHMIPVGHAQRVDNVSSIIGAAMKRRAFFKGVTALGSDELLDSHHSYHEEYKRHLNDLTAIPYDGYHTDYSLWALEYDNQQHDKEMISLDLSTLGSIASLGSLSDIKSSTYLYGPSRTPSFVAKETPGSSNELLGLTFIKEPDQADGIDVAKGVDRTDESDEVDQAARVDQVNETDLDSSHQTELRSDKPHRDDKSYDN